jgi:ribose 5-phosphate isomerase B
MSRRHNDANVLCLSADLLGGELLDRMVRIWLETPFEEGRHARRVAKITDFESKQ